MGLNLKAGMAGFVGGAAGTYKTIKKDQREWNMDQAAKQADMERQMHFESLMGKQRLQNQKDLGDYNRAAEVANVGPMTDARLQAEYGAATSPEGQKLREIGMEDARSQAQMEADIDVGRQKEIIGMQLQKAESILNMNTSASAKERKKSMDEAMSFIDQSDLPEEMKESLKWRTKMASYGIKIPKEATIDPEDYTNARKAAVSEAEQYGDDQILDFLTSRKTEGVTESNARKIFTDMLVPQYLSNTRKQGGKLTLESARERLMDTPAQERAAALDQLGKTNPTIATQLKEELNLGKNIASPSRKATPVEANPSAFQSFGAAVSGENVGSGVLGAREDDMQLMGSRQRRY